MDGWPATCRPAGLNLRTFEGSQALWLARVPRRPRRGLNGAAPRRLSTPTMDAPKPPTLTDLPEAVLAQVLDWLDLCDLCCLRESCKDLRESVDSIAAAPGTLGRPMLEGYYERLRERLLEAASVIEVALMAHEGRPDLQPALESVLEELLATGWTSQDEGALPLFGVTNQCFQVHVGLWHDSYAELRVGLLTEVPGLLANFSLAPLCDIGEPADWYAHFVFDTGVAYRVGVQRLDLAIPVGDVSFEHRCACTALHRAAASIFPDPAGRPASVRGNWPPEWT